MRLLLLISVLALSCASCTAPARKYSAPDFKRVDAAATRLSAAHGKLAATTARAETKLAAAQKNADAIAEHSASIISLVDQLAKLAPPEMQPRVADLKTAVQSEQIETGDLVTNLSGAQTEIGRLKQKEIPEAIAAKSESDAAVAAVKIDARKTADAATSESSRRYKAESQLLSHKIFKWVFRIGGGLIVVVIIALFIAGKISVVRI